jgi:hypothetical protein
LDPTTTRTARLFAGVDVSKDRLDVCLRWNESERHEEEAFVVAYDHSGVDALVSRLLKERPELVVLEATGGFERTVVGALAAAEVGITSVGTPAEISSLVLGIRVNRALPATTTSLKVCGGCALVQCTKAAVLGLRDYLRRFFYAFVGTHISSLKDPAPPRDTLRLGFCLFRAHRGRLGRFSWLWGGFGRRG